MNALRRFFTLGAADADARVARALAPRVNIDRADQYLHSSFVGRHLDRGTQLLESWWRTSAFGHTAASIVSGWRGESRATRYSALGMLLLIAAATHILLTVLQGPRPGWFWLLIPALAAGFGGLLLMAARAADSNR
jgi:hypothetical protein